MGEYEDRYPDAYGHGEVIEEDAAGRHVSGSELPRQTRDRAPSAHTARLEARRAPSPSPSAPPRGSAPPRAHPGPP